MEIEKYLALHGNENAYTAQLLEDLAFLVEREKYHLALNVYHWLFMTAIYQTILKARSWRRRKYVDALISFTSRGNLKRSEMLETLSSFSLSKLSESHIFEYLRLFDAPDDLIKDCKNLVKNRNERSHANGNYLLEAEIFEETIRRYDNALAKVHLQTTRYLPRILTRFIEDVPVRVDITRDDLELELISPHRLNRADLVCLTEICSTRRKAHRQIRAIVREEYRVVD